MSFAINANNGGNSKVSSLNIPNRNIFLYCVSYEFEKNFNGWEVYVLYNDYIDITQMMWV